MKIIEKLSAKSNDNGLEGVTIVFLGDSVTQGCFEIYKDGEAVHSIFDQESAYHKNLVKILNLLYPRVPVNVINAGISGGGAKGGFERLHRDVISHKPDLVVVCFGLNDVTGGMKSIGNYTLYLEKIFAELNKENIECIFMTPNMLNSNISPHIRYIDFGRAIAEKTLALQTTGVFDEYINAACEVAKRSNVTVCDSYAKWKMLDKNGVDTTELLANKINHPCREMHWLFAMELVQTIMN